MSEHPKKRRGPMTILRESRRARRWLFSAFMFCVLYPLSAGPAMWLYVHVLPDECLPAIQASYLPFQWLVRQSQVAMNVTLFYQDLWVTRADLMARMYPNAATMPTAPPINRSAP